MNSQGMPLTLGGVPSGCICPSPQVATSIDEMEQKMRHHEQTIYMLMEYIDTKVKAFHNHTVTNCRA